MLPDRDALAVGELGVAGGSSWNSVGQMSVIERARQRRQQVPQAGAGLRLDDGPLDVGTVASGRADRSVVEQRRTRRRSRRMRRHSRFAVVCNHPPSASGSRICLPWFSSICSHVHWAASRASAS